MKKVLFLCTGNSCRSQLAEAIVNARMGTEWEAVSAGTHPSGYVHPNALRTPGDPNTPTSSAAYRSIWW